VVTARLANGNPLPAAGWLSFNPATATFSGTPTAANRGAYDLVLVATNPLGSAIVSNVFHITVDDTLQSAYQLWAATRFPAPTLANPALEAGVWGMSANPDGDGSNNLLEMLFGTLPDQANPTPLTFQRLSASQSSLTFPLAKDFPMASLHVEWAADMTGWSRVGVAMTTQEDIHGIVWVTATITPPAPQSRLFVRVAAGP
jgi:hypothetical protein